MGILIKLRFVTEKGAIHQELCEKVMWFDILSPQNKATCNWDGSRGMYCNKLIANMPY